MYPRANDQVSLCYATGTLGHRSVTRTGIAMRRSAGQCGVKPLRCAKDDFHQSIEKIGIAFVMLIDEYEETKKGERGRSPFFFGESVHFADGLAADRSFESIRRSIEALQDAMKVLSIGIEYPRYAMFRMYTPAVLPVPGNPTVRWINTTDPTKKTTKTCLDFVIESAIQLQTAEYDMQQGEGEQRRSKNPCGMKKLARNLGTSVGFSRRRIPPHRQTVIFLLRASQLEPGGSLSEGTLRVQSPHLAGLCS